MFRQGVRGAGGILLLTFCIAAPAADGDLDTSFGANGFRRVGISNAAPAYPSGLALQPDGKILTCTTVSESSDDFLVVRFTADGALDASFSFDGRTTLDFGGNDDTCSGIAVQTDGKIVVAGSTSPAGGAGDFAVARLNADGTLDTTFGGGTGKAVIAFDLGGDNDDIANGLALRPNGKIVVVGSASTASSGRDFAILQLNGDGSRDTGFNLTGRVTVGFDFPTSVTKDDAAVAVAIDAQARIIAGGSADRGAAGGSDFAAIRLLPNGQLDPDFHANGRVTVAFDLGGATGSNGEEVYTLTLQRDGKIVLAGTTDSSPGVRNLDMAVARLLPDGSLDSGFGIGGKATVALDLIPNGSDYAIGSAQQANGKLVLAGTAFDTGAATMVAVAVRLNADGSPDAGFGTEGKRTYDFAQTVPSAQLFSGVAMQGHEIVLSGVLNVIDASHADFYVARMHSGLIFANGFE